MFNSERLRIARERRGMTMKELADATGLTSKTISNYENAGQFEEVNSKSIDLISKALGYPIAFFKAGEIETIQEEAISFRSSSKLTAKKRNSAIAAASLAVEISTWIDSKFSIPKPDVPTLDFDSQPVTPEEAARTIRASWGIGELSISNIVHLLESKGIRVFSLTENCIEVDAYSFWRDDIPYILLNTMKSPERSRFDAAHELAHLVLHRHLPKTGRQEELEADRFASAFLMPKSSVMSKIPRMPSLNFLIEVKKYWKVSLAALVRRTFDIGLSSDWHYRQLCMDLSRKGYRKVEPKGITNREVSMILEKVFHSLREQKIPRSQILSELNQLPVDEIYSLTFNNNLFNLNVISVNDVKTNSFPSLTKLRVVK